MSRNDSISGKPTKEYLDNWDRIFGKNKNETEAGKDDNASKKPKSSKSNK